MYEIFAYWNADQIRDVLNAVVLLMNGPDYLGLLKALAVGALLVAVGTGIARMKGEEPLGYFIMLAIFYGTLFVPKVTVSINDVRAAKVYTVANVPLGMAFFTSTTSHIGKWLTDSYENYVTSVDDLKFSQNGMAFGSRVAYEMQYQRIKSPVLHHEMVNFIENCVNPEFVNNLVGLEELSTSSDVWAAIGGQATNFSLNPGRSTIINSEAMSCVDAYNSLKPKLEVEAQKQLKLIANKLNTGKSLADDLILSQLPSVEAQMFDVSRSATDSMKQSFIANMLYDAQYRASPNASVDFSVAQATQGSLTSYGSMAAMAESALPKLRNGVELLIIALFPVIFLLIIIAGQKAGLVFKSYLMGMMWVQLWAPIYAIINYMSNYNDAEKFKVILNGGANSLAKMPEIAEIALTQSHIAGLLTISVPIIALAIIKGGEMAMSSAVSQIMSPAQGAAQKSGDAVGQGNLSGGNVQWGNSSANNWNGGNYSGGNLSSSNISGNATNMQTENALPNFTTWQGAGGTSVTYGPSGEVAAVSAPGWRMPGSVEASSNSSQSEKSYSGTGTSTKQGSSSSYESGTTSTSSSSMGAGFAAVLNKQLATDYSSGETGQVSNSAGAKLSGSQTTNTGESNSMSGTFGVGSNSAFNAANMPSKSGGTVNSGDAVPANVQSGGGSSSDNSKNQSLYDRLQNGQSKGGYSIGGGVNTNVAWQLAHMASDNSGATSSADKQSAVNMLSSAAEKIAATTTDSNTRTAANNLLASLNNTAASRTVGDASVSKEQNAGDSNEANRQNSMGGSFSDGSSVLQAAAAITGTNLQDPKQALALLQSMQSNPALSAAATAAAADNANSTFGGGWMGQQGLADTSVTSQGEVFSAGSSAVSRQAATGSEKVAESNNQANAAVEAQQHAVPDATDAPTGFDTAKDNVIAQIENNERSLAGVQNSAAQQAGIATAANHLWSNNDTGMSAALKNSLGFGFGYDSPNQYSDTLQEMSKSDHAVSSTLIEIGNRGSVSEGEEEFLMTRIKNFEK